MTTFFEAVVLGLVQGITEWLPISSSGHLQIFKKFMDVEEPVIFSVVLHLATLLALLLVFHKEIKGLVVGVMRRDRYSLNFLLLLVIATIPIVLAGFFLNDFFKSESENLRHIGYFFILSSIFIYLSKYPLKKKKALTKTNSLFIGLAQMFALLPGISRSGSTLSAALLLGIKKKDAAFFAFMLAIPAIIGAFLLEIPNIGSVSNIDMLALSGVVALVSGILSLKLVLKIIDIDKFHHFAWYKLAVGILILAMF